MSPNSFRVSFEKLKEIIANDKLLPSNGEQTN
jgi:hypothetical protein